MKKSKPYTDVKLQNLEILIQSKVLISKYKILIVLDLWKVKLYRVHYALKAINSKAYWILHLSMVHWWVSCFKWW
jgi:hypothetical protein